jgi:hypothetical protein
VKDQYGNYLTTACQVNTPANGFEAEELCKTHGMKIFETKERYQFKRYPFNQYQQNLPDRFPENVYFNEGYGFWVYDQSYTKLANALCM